jgi:hypothetical protein
MQVLNLLLIQAMGYSLSLMMLVRRQLKESRLSGKILQRLLNRIMEKMQEYIFTIENLKVKISQSTIPLKK